LDENLDLLNGRTGHPQSFDFLERLLDRQVFRLSHWKTATAEINYRRFFDVNGLICMKAEEEAVFVHSHRLVFQLASENPAMGLRIDHIDGLRDPGTYLERLRRRLPDAFMVVEKILAATESLPGAWPVQGTTGYEFAVYLNGLLCRDANEGEMEALYRKFTGEAASPDALLASCKRKVLKRQMAGDLDNLGHVMKRLSGCFRHGRDLTLPRIEEALEEILVRFPEVLLPGEPAEKLSEDEKALRRKAAGRFQQLSAPLTAKGLEDTFLYVYNRLVSLNEVGGNPDRFGFSPHMFHEFIRARKKSWPHSMNATATQDTKRGEDVRTRIDVLSEVPEAWEEALAVFVEEVLNDHRFLKAFLPFQKRISWYGMLGSLSQTLIKITAPGIPDFYQGCELWDLNLVDPDNRRPVDFDCRKKLVEPGEYLLGEAVWEETEILLPEDAPLTWEDIFTADICPGSPSLRAAAIFRDFPVALLLGSV
jgi:(1->4)-alpha-D-glucan 1-alpha-D-glucosylmutase